MQQIITKMLLDSLKSAVLLQMLGDYGQFFFSG
jgi:hypothetical protein